MMHTDFVHIKLLTCCTTIVHIHNGFKNKLIIYSLPLLLKKAYLRDSLFTNSISPMHRFLKITPPSFKSLNLEVCLLLKMTHLFA